MDLKAILNLLVLLNEEPKGIQELYDSGCFYGWNHLHSTIKVCLKAGLIGIECVGRVKLDVNRVMSRTLHERRWHKAINYFFITSMGLNLLSLYDGCKVKKVNSKRRIRHLTSAKQCLTHWLRIYTYSVAL